MQALQLSGKDQPLIVKDVPDPEPPDGEVLVHLRAAALNHRDVFITRGLYPGITYPVIMGSDGAGRLEDGKEVILNPALFWGGNARVPSPDFQILGLPRQGTFATRICIPESQVYEKPDHLAFTEAAALPLAGLTAYRALFTRGRLMRKERVLISGIGGGVALFALQFAVASQAEVWVTSSSDDKIQRAIGLGARGGARYDQENGWKKLKKDAGGFDLIIDSAGGDGFSVFPKLCNHGGRIVTYGGTRGSISDLSPQVLFWKQLDIMGTTMGNDQEFAAMVDLVNTHAIKPVIDEVLPLSEASQGFERMRHGKQFGKIVFELEG